MTGITRSSVQLVSTTFEAGEVDDIDKVGDVNGVDSTPEPTPAVVADSFEPAKATATPVLADNAPELPLADAVRLSKSMGPKKLQAIQTLIDAARAKGPSSAEALSAMSVVLSGSGSSTLQRLIPFGTSAAEFGKAFSGTDANERELTTPERVRAAAMGVLNAVVDSAGGAVGKAVRLVTVVDQAKTLTQWAPLISDLAQRGADADTIAKFAALTEEPALLERFKGSIADSFSELSKP